MTERAKNKTVGEPRRLNPPWDAEKYPLLEREQVLREMRTLALFLQVQPAHVKNLARAR